MDRFRLEILELINAHDGEFSWYQLDRALTNFSKNHEENMPQVGGLTKVVDELVGNGFIAKKPGHQPSMPLYVITDTGREELRRRET